MNEHILHFLLAQYFIHESIYVVCTQIWMFGGIALPIDIKAYFYLGCFNQNKIFSSILLHTIVIFNLFWVYMYLLNSVHCTYFMSIYTYFIVYSGTGPISIELYWYNDKAREDLFAFRLIYISFISKNWGYVHISIYHALKVS